MLTKIDCNRPNPHFGSMVGMSEKEFSKFKQYIDLDLPTCRRAYATLCDTLEKQSGNYHVKYNAVDNSFSVVEGSLKNHHEIKNFPETHIYQNQKEIGNPKGVFGKIKAFFKAIRLHFSHPEKNIKANFYDAYEFATKMNGKNYKNILEA